MLRLKRFLVSVWYWALPLLLHVSRCDSRRCTGISKAMNTLDNKLRNVLSILPRSCVGSHLDFRQEEGYTPGYNFRNAVSTSAKTRFLWERRYSRVIDEYFCYINTPLIALPNCIVTRRDRTLPSQNYEGGFSTAKIRSIASRCLFKARCRHQSS